MTGRPWSVTCRSGRLLITVMRNQTELVQLLDRYRIGLAQRLVIGLSVANDFSSVDGTLMLAEGRGKWLRPRWFEYDRIEIPQSIARACLGVRESDKVDAGEFLQVRADLTRQLPDIITQLTRRSGKASKRLLVTCVDDPGIWPKDFDGDRSYSPFCDATLLAEISGMTIVDALPERDLAAGGRGEPLYPLAYWLLFADRNEKIANTFRLVIRQDKVTLLPPSDGLDNELPMIREFNIPDQMESLIKILEDARAEAELEVTIDCVLTCEAAEESMNNLQDRLPGLNPWCGKELNCSPAEVQSMAVAALGLMHLDQMSATLPWLTGCEYPRILGRLTPGRPSNWRQVIMEMADYHPPAMKLREAV